MTLTNFARILLVVPATAAFACGGSSGSGTGGTGGHPTTGSTTTTSAGTGGTTTGSTTTTGTGGATSSTTGTTASTTSTTSVTSTTSTTSATTSSTSSTGGTQGACTDAADMAVNMTQVGNDASGCVTSSCIGQYISSDWTGLATCVATCLQTMDSLTNGCAACWGTVVSCGAQHCASMCAGGDSASCNTCTNQFCQPAFDTCAGS
jgi:hypothetical protein